jgi:hypothetical protein
VDADHQEGWTIRRLTGHPDQDKAADRPPFLFGFLFFFGINKQGQTRLLVI